MKITLASVSSNKKDYSSLISQQRIMLAKNLISSISENPQVGEIITSECKKKFDGDFDVLCNDLFNKSVNQSNSKSIKIGEMVNETAKLNKVKSLTNININDFANTLISNDSLLQIYYYICNGDSTNFEGIVIVPEGVKERDGKDLLVIKKDGSESYIRSDIDPHTNYLVISKNERVASLNIKSSNSQLSYAKKVKMTGEGKNMSIVQATFTSMDAKRTVEDWFGGEPEVRLNVLYPLINPTTNLIVEARNSSFLYPGQWLKLGLFENTVKWNTTLVQCPFWLSNEKNYGRRLIWTEEDGTSAATTINNIWTEKTIGLTTSINTTIPATNNDKVIADSWIDYDQVGTGTTYTWAIIKFQISCN